MRIVIIADIHGNLPALEAALADIEKLRPDQIIVAGDIVDGGPDSAACWERVKALGCPVLRGNHERYVYDFDTEQADPQWADPQFAPLHVARADLTNDQITELAALPFRWSSPDAPGLMVVHASPRSDNDSLFAYTPDELVDTMFAGAAGIPVIVRGHNHHCAQREWSGGRIVTSGSVGLAQDGNPLAQYVVLEQTASERDGWRVWHRIVRYDVAATLRRFHDSGYLAKAGPMGRLFYREVATGTHQVVPFLRFQSAQRQAGVYKSLAESVDQFIADI